MRACLQESKGDKMLQLEEIRSQLPALMEQIEEVGGYL